MNNKLIIVEGLPCAGKSSTSKHIAQYLKQCNKKVVCMDEGTGNHPTDYEFHAYLSDNNMVNLETDLQEKIKKYSERVSDGFIFPLAKAGDSFDTLLSYKIYDFLPWDDEMPIMLNGWKRFLEARNKETIYVFNCCTLQNAMCETMIRFNFSIERSKDYISHIFGIAKEMNPFVIYLQCGNVWERVKVVSAERDEPWLSNAIDYHVNSSYGRSKNFEGFNGYIKCLEDRQEREIEILNTLPIDKLIVQNPYDNWSGTYKKIYSELFQLRFRGEDSDK